MDKKLEDRCVYYDVARTLRQEEKDKGIDLEGTKGFDIMGCFKCEGYDKYCGAYTTMED